MDGRRHLGAAVLAVVLLAVGCDGTPDVARPRSPSTSAPRSTNPVCRERSVAPHPDQRYRTVAGVDPDLLSLDLWVPRLPTACATPPLVVYVHGGGFARGDKANQITDKVRRFTAEGWAFASVNYRLSPAVRYPTHEQDVATALRWLRDHGRTLGFDPDRLLLVGHSSGAFLVSLLGTDQSFLSAAGVPRPSIRGVVSLDTEYDVPTQVAQGGNQEALYRQAFGDDPAVWAKGSPLRQITAGEALPPFLVVTQGSTRRTTQAQDFGAALRAAGGRAAVRVVTTLDHEGINDAVGAPGDTVVTPPLLAFARSVLG